jgi:hypothetical protein
MAFVDAVLEAEKTAPRSKGRRRVGSGVESGRRYLR